MTTGTSLTRCFSGVLAAAALLSAGPGHARGPDAVNMVGRHGDRPELARAAQEDAKDAALERLGVRVGEHENFTRLVFDWPAAVAYSLTESDTKVTVTFARGARINLRRLRSQLGRGLANPRVRLREGRLEFTIERPPGLKVRHFAVGPKVVLDFGTAIGPEPQGDAKPARKAGSPSDAAPVVPDAPGRKTAAASAPVEKAARSAAAVPAPGKRAVAAGKDVAPAKPGDDAPKPAGATLIFEFPEPAGAAMFRREPYVWIVFDRRIQPSLDALRKSAAGLIKSMEQLPAGAGTAFRVEPTSGVNPQAERDGDRWIVRLRRWPIAPQSPIALRVRTDGGKGAEVVLPVPELGRILHVPDPGVGDTLIVATLRASGHGVSGRRRYPQFELLASAQGVAVKPLDDDVELRDAGALGVAVTRANGLHLSSVAGDGAVSGIANGPRVFDFANWAKGSAKNYNTALQAAIRATVEAAKGRRNDARLDLARLYFSRGMAPEALGALRAIESANSPLARQPEFRALKGASLAYMGRHGDAREYLLDTRLDRYREIALWRASMYFHAGEKAKAAALFRAGDEVLRTYHEPFRTRFALERIEAGIDARDIANASVWSKRLDERAAGLTRRDLARLRYCQGLLARHRGDLDRAVKYWTEAKTTKDRWNGARAEFALIDLGLQQETIGPDEAVERLERLSFQWRGDELELGVLDRLGELYLAKGDYRRSLARMRTAVTYFPDTDSSRRIAGRMGDVFKSLYLDGKADRMAPLKALALFDDFRELTPAGPGGDLMIRKLADRLIGIGLFDRAAGLLSHQVRFRLEGYPKAEGGAKLALIHLLDRNPKAALLALRESYQPNLPQRIEDDRRRIRAKAKLDLGQSEEAIALLAGDVSTDADLLRLDLYWKSKNYAEAAKVLQRLAGEPSAAGEYGSEQTRYVLIWAVALRLNRDEAGLKTLRDLYGAGMAKSRLAETFAFIVGSPGGSREDVEAISRRVVEADGFDRFLRNYRERLMPPTTAVSTEKTIQGGEDSAPEATSPAGPEIPAPPPLPNN